MKRYSLNGASNKMKDILLIGILALYCCGTIAFAQSVRDTDYKADRSYQSNARINPSTLAMELSIPLMDFPGRAGNSVPLTFNYSSKVWTMRIWDSIEPTKRIENGGQGTQQNPYLVTYITSFQPEYSERAVAGWTNNLQPVMELWDDRLFEFEVAMNEYLFYVKRVRIRMPDGSTHELRKDDQIYDCFNSNPPIQCESDSRNGTYLSVDGSGMRLVVEGQPGNYQSALYLPDGGRYILNNSTQQYIDKHGNKMFFDVTARKLTDTLGREIYDPLPPTYFPGASVGPKPFQLPGISGQRTYTQQWQKLKPDNCVVGTELSCLEAGLETPTDQLYYLGTDTCQNFDERTPLSPSLFTVDPTYTNPRVEPNGNSNTYYLETFKQRQCGGSVFNPIVLTEINLPNGTKYQFRYNRYGEITKIIYPTGGYERFRYDIIGPLVTLDFPYNQANRGVVERWVSADGVTETQHWTYNSQPTLIEGQLRSVVTTIAPDNTKTERIAYASNSLHGFEDPRAGRALEEKFYSKPATPGNEQTRTLLRRELTDWIVAPPRPGGNTQWGVRDARPAKTISIVFEPGAPQALARMIETIYDSHTDEEYFAHLNPKRVKTYNYIALDLTTAKDSKIDQIAALFSNSNLAVIGETDYLYDLNYKARNITNVVTETRVKDASENIKARSEISYDESIYSLPSSGSMPSSASNTWVDLTQPPEPGVLHPVQLGATIGSKRGLPTTVKGYSDVAAGEYVEKHNFYDQYSNLRKVRDGRGKDSETQYDPSYAFAYPTKVISPPNNSNMSFETTVAYDYTTGLLTSTTDTNGQMAQMQYIDPLLRPTRVKTAVGTSEEVWMESEYGAGISAGTRYVKTRTQIDQSNWKTGYTWFDGLGRTIKSQSVDSNDDVFVETEYDNMGRIKKVSNPFRMGETVYKTENFYDDLGRVVKVKTPDLAEVNTTYSLTTSVGSEIGTVVTVTDPAEKNVRSINNAQGQLTRVDEATGSNDLGSVDSPNQATHYTYDTLGKMVRVQQGAQYRYFKYDSLGRLLRVRQPEQQVNPALNTTGDPYNNQWTGGFTYDNNGNVLTATDAKNTTITNHNYDALNRPQTRTYSDGTTPTVTFTYDDPNVPLSKGKLTKVSNSVSTSQTTEFDILGRPKIYQQVTDGTTYTSKYTYNLAGALVEEEYPSGRTVKNEFDADGELSRISGKKNPSATEKTYADQFTYTAAGAVEKMHLGNNLWEAVKFNSRLQIIELGLGVSATNLNRWKVNYDYGEIDGSGNLNTYKNNGNIARQTISFDGLAAPFVQSYKYDALNRLKEAKEMNGAATIWQQTFDYDRYGNRTSFSQQGGPTPSVQPTIDSSTNRFHLGQGYSYDENGNIIADPTNGGRSFTFNGDNKQTLVKNASNQNIGQYFYDGEGRRVKKVTAAETTIFIYSGGKLVAEYSTQAPSQNPTTNYIVTDILQSVRVISDADGNVTSRRDFMPFGEELLPDVTYRTTNLKYGSANDNIRQKFTGYQKDEETQLDFAEARMYNNGHGRFTAVDPLLASGKSANPQTFNRYIYVGNNPINITDPLGLIWYYNKRQNRYDWYDEESKKFTYSDDELNADWEKVSAFRYYAGEEYGWVALDETSANWFAYFETELDVLDSSVTSARTDWEGIDTVDTIVDGVLGPIGVVKGGLKYGIKRGVKELAEFVAKEGAEKLTRAEVVEQILKNAGGPVSKQALNQIVGAIGENIVEAALRSEGYNIVEKNVAVRVTLDDGSEGLRYIDRLVERDGVYTAVEVKSGGAEYGGLQRDKDKVLGTKGGIVVSRKPGVPDSIRGTRQVWQTMVRNVLP